MLLVETRRLCCSWASDREVIKKRLQVHIRTYIGILNWSIKALRRKHFVHNSIGAGHRVSRLCVCALCCHLFFVVSFELDLHNHSVPSMCICVELSENRNNLWSQIANDSVALVPIYATTTLFGWIGANIWSHQIDLVLLLACFPRAQVGNNFSNGHSVLNRSQDKNTKYRAVTLYHPHHYSPVFFGSEVAL